VPLNRNHVFDSQGPDLRLRGTAQQLFERYLQLGRDATSSGDRVMAESYFQYAEHYFRILGAMQAAQQQSQQGNGAGGYSQPSGGQPNGYNSGSHNGPRRYQGDSPGDGQQDGDDEGDRQESGAADEPMTEQRREIPINEAPPED
jgi:hypothetical protein